MRLTLDMLGHRFQLSLDGLNTIADEDEELDEDAEDEEPQRDSQLDALVERADPHMPPIGFYPPARYE